MPVDHSWRAAASAVHLLHRASRVADAVFGRLVGSALTPRQFVVLATVAENEGINQMAIILSRKCWPGAAPAPGHVSPHTSCIWGCCTVRFVGQWNTRVCVQHRCVFF
jgi:hypothetical protein